MNASKENAREALRIFEEELSIADRATCPEDDDKTAKDKEYVRAFLVAAARKLPSEAAYEREKARLWARKVKR
jgi:hypothetical protein